MLRYTQNSLLYLWRERTTNLYWSCCITYHCTPHHLFQWPLQKLFYAPSPRLPRTDVPLYLITYCYKRSNPVKPSCRLTAPPPMLKIWNRDYFGIPAGVFVHQNYVNRFQLWHSFGICSFISKKKKKKK